MANNNERKLKIVPKYFPRRWKDAVFPEIRLAGKWLQDLGFTCGNFVVITQSENSITITTLPEVKAAPVAVKKKREKPSFIPPEIAHLPNNQVFQQWEAEDYHVYVQKIKEEKERRKRVSKERAWEDFKKERLKAKPQTPQELAAKQKIIQLHPEIKQVAAPKAKQSRRG